MESYNFNAQEIPTTDSEAMYKEMPAPIEPKVPGLSKNRVRSFINSTLTATTLLGAMSAENATAGEEQRFKDAIPPIEYRSGPKTVEVKDRIEARDCLKEFGNPDITIGKPQFRVRWPVEQIGIFYKGNYVTHLHSRGFGGFTREDFVSGLTNILDKAGIPHNNVSLEKTDSLDKEVSPEKELTIEAGVEQKVAELGMIMRHATKTLADGKEKRVVTLSANTQLEDKSKSVFYEIDEDSDGRADSYAKIYISPEGTLVLEGKDGESFKIEFKRGANGEVIVEEITK